VASLALVDDISTAHRIGTTETGVDRVCSVSMSTLKRIAPVFAVRDLRASLAHYERLGFATREYEGGGYGYASRDGIEIHLGLVPAGDPRAIRSTAYLWVDNADELAQAWRLAGGDIRLPEDTAWGQHEGVVIDPDGNIIRFGSPIAPTGICDRGTIGAAAQHQTTATSS